MKYVIKLFERKKIVYDTNTNTKMFVDIVWNKQPQQEVHEDALCTIDDNGKKDRLLTKREVKMAGYWPSSFLRVYGAIRSRVPSMIRLDP